MKYYTVKFTFSPYSEAARDLLAAECGEHGFESFDLYDDKLDGFIRVDLFDEKTLDDIVNHFIMPDVEISYTFEEAEDKNWNEQWEANGFETINIQGKCCIYDAKHQAAMSDTDTMVCIGIDARQAFGTGTHDTTQMMVSELIELDLHQKRVLDCGCGTGILSIVAAKFGASDVVGYDIDEWSVNNSRHNASINNIENIEILEGDVRVLSHVNGLFDVVLANINRNILIEDMFHFKDVMAKDGLLIVSGFYSEDAHLIVDAAHQLGLHAKGHQERNGWCMLKFEL
ncbi:MAG: 50S ribosomal protein L11 methyltransferase [Prevotella sp.]|nr:50S ribosomal protein L11 methyltransferase [Prevotella sp.]